MKKNVLINEVKIVLLLTSLTFLLSASKIQPKNLDLFLLIGQSNMAGRGVLESDIAITTPGIWMVNSNDEWVPAKNPVHFDKPTVVGVGPGLSFAERVYSTRNKRNIGLIPCAVGGSGIDQWIAGVRHEQTGINPYDAMIERVRVAQQSGKIRAVLWHQGESDSSLEKSEVYEEKLRQFFVKLRKDLKLKETPIIMGELGHFYIAKNPTAVQINKAMIHLASTERYLYYVSSEGLKDKGDETHFDSASAKILGERYAEKYLSVIK